MSELAPLPPPDFPRMLAGGPERLRLSRTAVAWIVGVGLAVQAAAITSFAADRWPLHLAGAAATLVYALLTAVVTARWLAGPMGLVAGLLQLTGLQAFYSHAWPSALAAPMIGALAAAALGLFARVNVPSRLGSDEQTRTKWFFHICGAALVFFGGFGPWSCVAAVCLTYVLWNQDGRALRWLCYPPGLAALAAALVGTVWRDGLPPSPQGFEVSSLALIAYGTMPWTPLCAIAAAGGCRQGLHAVPFWRLAACWALAPMVWGGCGWIDPHGAATLAAAPLSILAAGGFNMVRQYWLEP